MNKTKGVILAASIAAGVGVAIFATSGAPPPAVAGATDGGVKAQRPGFQCPSGAFMLRSEDCP